MIGGGQERANAKFDILKQNLINTLYSIAKQPDMLTVGNDFIIFIIECHQALQKTKH